MNAQSVRQSVSQSVITVAAGDNEQTDRVEVNRSEPSQRAKQPSTPASPTEFAVIRAGTQASEDCRFEDSPLLANNLRVNISRRIAHRST